MTPQKKPRKPRRTFTSAALAIAAQHCETWAEVADRLGVCRSAVTKFVATRPYLKLGRPKREAWLDEIARLADLRMTQEEIADALGCCAKTIHKAMREHGIAHRSRRRTAEERIRAREEMHRLYRARMARMEADDAAG